MYLSKFLWSKIAIYFSLGLYKGRPSYRRSLQLSKENIQHLKTWNFFTFSYFCRSSLSSWIRIQQQWRYVLYFSSILFECQNKDFFKGPCFHRMKPVAQTLRRTNQSLCKSSLLFSRSSSFFQERPTRTFVSPRTFSSSKNSCKSRRGALSPNQHRWTAANGCSVTGSRKRSLPAGAEMDSRFTARAATRDIVIFWRPLFSPFWKKNGGYTVEGLLRLISDTRIYRIECKKYYRSPKVFWSTPKILQP